MESDQKIQPEICPRCGKSLEIRKGTYGTYLDCMDYPKCKYTYDLSSKNVAETKQISNNTPSSCPKCGKKLALYIGKFGIFLGCNGFPKCNYSQNFEDPYNITCPKCEKIMKERTGTYVMFYGCSGYPECKFTFDLRVKAKPEEKKRSKKVILPEVYGFKVTGDDILGNLTRGGQDLRELRIKEKPKEIEKSKMLVLLKEKKRSKKVALPEVYGFNIKGNNILGALTRDGQNLRELINKLELIYVADINYLKLKLKEFENKGFVVKISNENETIWKKKESFAEKK